MKWDELTDKDKVKLILQHVYGYYFVEDEHYVARNRGKLPKDFHWPIAWWDETLEYWGIRDISSNWNISFDPLHDMNDAWQIFQAMSDAYTSNRITFEQLADFTSRVGKRWQIYAGSLDPLPTAEDFCLDALRAMGVEIE